MLQHVIPQSPELTALRHQHPPATTNLLTQSTPQSWRRQTPSSKSKRRNLPSFRSNPYIYLTSNQGRPLHPPIHPATLLIIPPDPLARQIPQQPGTQAIPRRTRNNPHRTNRRPRRPGRIRRRHRTRPLPLRPRPRRSPAPAQTRRRCRQGNRANARRVGAGRVRHAG